MSPNNVVSLIHSSTRSRSLNGSPDDLDQSISPTATSGTASAIFSTSSSSPSAPFLPVTCSTSCPIVMAATAADTDDDDESAGRSPADDDEDGMSVSRYSTLC